MSIYILVHHHDLFCNCGRLEGTTRANLGAYHTLEEARAAALGIEPESADATGWVPVDLDNLDPMIKTDFPERAVAGWRVEHEDPDQTAYTYEFLYVEQHKMSSPIQEG